MKSIAQLTEPDVQVELVPIDLIDFDALNPNELDATTYETLKVAIRETGFKQPVLLWRTGDRYRMIDGEHRTRIVSELGGVHVPAVVDDAPSEDEARMRLLTMNKLRGEFVPIRYALLIADLVQRIPESEIRRRLAMSEPELRDSLRLATFTDDVVGALREAVDREARESPVALRFVLAQRDAEAVERVIGSVLDGKVDRGQALAKVCRAYERMNKKEKANA